MFCMNCGQQLPDGAKFCLHCGTLQGATSPQTTSPEAMNLNNNHTFVPAMCPNCNAHMKVDSSSKIARCESCGTECLVQDAIKALTIKGNVQVGNATINVTGMNTESLLRRVEIMLADGDFDGAVEKCDTILDSDPTNGKAYLYLLMSSLKCEKKEYLAKMYGPYNKNPYYEKVLQFGDEDLVSELKNYHKANTKFAAKLKELQVNSELEFGSYKGKDIRWKVINIRSGMVCLITSDIIRHKPYHKSFELVTWENCDLRAWLNNYFIKNYFSSVERKRIVNTTVPPEPNTFPYSTNCGDQTEDKVFLLSNNEAMHLFKNNDLRVASDWWWLRVPGKNNCMACFVEIDGKVERKGASVHSDGGVRPVMWIRTG